MKEETDQTGSRQNIKESVSSWKRDPLQYFLISIEVMFITLVADIILFPFLILAGIFQFSLNFKGTPLEILDLPDTTLFIIALVNLFTMLIILGFLLGLVIPGMINSIYKTKDGVKIKFGDVYRFGKREWLGNAGLFLIDLFLLTVLLFISIMIISLFMVIISLLGPAVTMLLSMVVSLFIIAFIFMVPMIVIPLSYVIKYRERETNIGTVYKTSKFVIGNKRFLIGLGFYLLLTLMISVLIPVLSAITGLFLLPFLLTVLIIYYEKAAHPEEIQRTRYPRRRRPGHTGSGRESVRKRGASRYSRTYHSIPGIRRIR